MHYRFGPTCCCFVDRDLPNRVGERSLERVQLRRHNRFPVRVPVLKCEVSEVDRTKIDAGDDDAFYDSPRFVTHADDGFLDALTETYASCCAMVTACSTR